MFTSDHLRALWLKSSEDIDQKLKPHFLMLDQGCPFSPVFPDLQEFAQLQAFNSMDTDFPMFEWNDSENRLEALHHPFTAPTLKT
ncbi:hypothetical protein L6164_032148 [Bauhinia variegata]|uniref:Uncharacterized protein n=1 Tax=Bauhinia variegata TaxID=167791 RepID=A0ACB9KMY8_BAUVA|nr:hypothetical protein L6164_032148 [Bauhinia variegata]